MAKAKTTVKFQGTLEQEQALLNSLRKEDNDEV